MTRTSLSRRCRVSIIYFNMRGPGRLESLQKFRNHSRRRFWQSSPNGSPSIRPDSCGGSGYRASVFPSSCVPAGSGGCVLEVLGEPVVDLFIKVAAVFGLGDPVPGIGPDEQSAGDVHALQGAPVFEGVAEGYAIVAFADAEEHGRLPLGCVGE